MAKKISSDESWMFEREKQHPNEWRRLLHELYRENYIWYTASEFNSVVEHPILAPRLGLSQRSLEKSMQFLKANNLVKYQDMGGTLWVFLTPKGFDVAREEQNHKLNALLNSVIIYLTTTIALTTMFELFDNLSILDKSWIFWSYIITITLTAIMVYDCIFRRLLR